MSPFDRESDPMPCRHVDHFSCAKCEKPFLGGRYFEKAGLAYCETHFLQLFGSVCYVCDKVNATHYALTRFRSIRL